MSENRSLLSTIADSFAPIHRDGHKVEDIRAQAERLAPAFASACPGAQVAVVECASQIGSGALPVERLPSAAISLRPLRPGKGDGAWLNSLGERLRALPVPVIGRVANDALLLDIRTLEDEAALVDGIAGAAPLTG